MTQNEELLHHEGGEAQPKTFCDSIKCILEVPFNLCGGHSSVTSDPVAAFTHYIQYSLLEIIFRLISRGQCCFCFIPALLLVKIHGFQISTVVHKLLKRRFKTLL